MLYIAYGYISIESTDDKAGKIATKFKAVFAFGKVKRAKFEVVVLHK